MTSRFVCRHRSRHHELRAGVGGYVLGPRRPSTCRRSRSSSTRASRAPRRCCHRFSTSPATSTFRQAASLCRGTPIALAGHRRCRAKARRREPVAARREREIVALVTAARAASRRSCRGVRPRTCRTSRPSKPRLPTCGISRAAFDQDVAGGKRTLALAQPGRAADGAGLVRRGSARAHAAGGRRRRA